MQKQNSECDVSVGIVNWNTARNLSICLDRLRDACRQVRCEVIVVDNHSSDGSAVMVERDFPWVTMIANTYNAGYARANNQAFDRASGRYFLLLNPDVFLQDTTVTQMAGFLDNHQQAAAVAPRYLNPDGSFQRFYRRWPDLTTFLCTNTLCAGLLPRSLRTRVLRRYRYELSGDSFDAVRTLEQPGSSCLLLRSSLFRQIGLFDERFPLYFNDVDLCRRVYRKGYQIYFLPDAQAVHLLGASQPKQSVENRAEYFTGWLRYLRKHHGIAVYVAAWSIFFCDCLLLGVLYLIERGLGRRNHGVTAGWIRFRVRALLNKSLF